jgi:hypothetical protein
MAVWEELRAVLVRLRDQQPGALMRYPTLDADQDRELPVSIGLAPWATAAAEDLHRQFGDSVELTVGFLPYPPGRRPPDPRVGRPPADLLDPRDITAELDRPAVVRSGYTLRDSLLLLRNLTSRELQIATSGQVTADVADPQTGEVVGGFAAPGRPRLVIFRVAPGQAEQIPLLISTASSTPRLGYAIPPGNWAIQVTLTLGPHPADSPRRRTPLLPLTIT